MMNKTNFQQLIDSYKTPDLLDMSRDQLIQEVAWLRYLYIFYLTRVYMKRASGGKMRGKLKGTENTKYDEYRECVAKVILAKDYLGEKISLKTLERDLENRPEINGNLIKTVLTAWNRYRREILAVC